MDFLYNPRKAAQAGAYIVQLGAGRMGKWKLIKLLYLSDRLSLVRHGRTITGDKMCSMKLGPILSHVYDAIKHPDQPGSKTWKEYLSEPGQNTIVLHHSSPSSDELSQFEREILEASWKTYGGWTFERLKVFTHALPEYEDPGTSSLPIDPETILKAEGWTPEDIADAAQSAREEKQFRSLCA